MIKRIYVVAVVVATCLLNYSIQAVEKIADIELGDDYKLTPYMESHRSALEDVVNDPGVYKHIRHGGKWDNDLLNRRHRFYVDHNKAFNRGDKYDPATFAACWVLTAPNGEVIGRGGLQDSDEYAPVMTEVFFAIKGDYQGKKLGGRAFQQIINWFHNNVGRDVPLRWLAMDENKPSVHLAKALGFKPVFENDQQVEIDGWDMKYLVFHMDSTHKE